MPVKLPPVKSLVKLKIEGWKMPIIISAGGIRDKEAPVLVIKPPGSVAEILALTVSTDRFVTSNKAACVNEKGVSSNAASNRLLMWEGLLCAFVFLLS